MIGMVPWGIVKNKESLIVKAGSINYGYKTRRPIPHTGAEKSIKTEPRQHGQVALDSHHSHFVLVKILRRELERREFFIVILDSAGG